MYLKPRRYLIVDGRITDHRSPTVALQGLWFCLFHWFVFFLANTTTFPPPSGVCSVVRRASQAETGTETSSQEPAALLRCRPGARALGPLWIQAEGPGIQSQGRVCNSSWIFLSQSFILIRKLFLGSSFLFFRWREHTAIATHKLHSFDPCYEHPIT